MDYVIITVAGISSRFNVGETIEALKCIYYEEEYIKTLLYSIIKKCTLFDKIVIVGGHQYDNLIKYASVIQEEVNINLELIYNPEYNKHGSGYSFYKGIEACLKNSDCSSITLIEGDLFFDYDTMNRIYNSSKSCITINTEPIYANKSVILYINNNDIIKYLFNTIHGNLKIDEPFSALFNSGQVWKFKDINMFERIKEEMEICNWYGTNLEFVEKYFQAIPYNDIEFIQFNEWMNCNTRKDYMMCKEKL